MKTRLHRLSSLEKKQPAPKRPRAPAPRLSGLFLDLMHCSDYSEAYGTATDPALPRIAANSETENAPN
jgi:hypothetical protein